MTLKQLLNETYALGFSEEPELTEGFIFAANRALVRIVSELGAESLARITVPTDGARLIRDELMLKSGESFTAELTGAAYSFIATGSGSCEITCGGKKSTFPFSGAYTAIRGFTPNGGLITIRANSSVTVSDLASFEFTDALRESDIPLFGDARKIMLSSLIPDLFRVTSPIEDYFGNPAPITLTGDAIYPDRGFSGKITVRYKRCPKKISRDEENAPIDIPRELETLLPLLTASYIWLDDDAQRAQYYLELYMSEAARIKGAFPDSFGSWKNVTGWA